MLKYTLIHYTDDDDDPDTGLFYDALIARIDEMTHLANAEGNALELEFDEGLESLVVRRIKRLGY